MAMMIRETGPIADAQLPLADLAAQLRLPDGYEAIPEQVTRLRMRLRAALETVEQRSGKILIAREVTLSGTTADGARVILPIAPVTEVISVEVGFRSRETLRLEVERHRAVVHLGGQIPEGARVAVRCEAGFGGWGDVADGLRQAVLLVAEALDTGEETAAAVARLVAPHALRRVGGAG